MFDTIWLNAKLATMTGEQPYGLIEDGAIAARGDRIAWVGLRAELPGEPQELASRVRDGGGRVITPGLVDSHTHVVYVGKGLLDFEILARGGSREELINGGGGVRGMIRRTRAAGDEELYRSSVEHCVQLIVHGVTTLESKSGGGLDLETELRMMRISRRLGRDLPLTVVSSFLGAHGVAPEYDGRPDDYIDFLVRTVLPAAVEEGLVDAVDGFCDTIGFSHPQIERLFAAAEGYGLPVRLHADQYSESGAGGLVAKWKGLTADHLEYVSEQSVRAMAEADTVATLLPGANWTLHETKRPPVNLLRRHGVSMALATNNNPVSSPTTSPTMIMHMACHMFGMTPEEALTGFTRNGAKALGMAADRGTLEQGKMADMVVWDIEHPTELSYHIAANPCQVVIKEGAVVYEAAAPQIGTRTTGGHDG
jgi:imidazolonepropionase